MFAGMERLERLLGQVLERLERSPDPALAHQLAQLVADIRTPATPDRDARPTPTRPEPKAAVVQRLRTMQAEGLSLQAIANRLNTEGLPTLSGKGRWQKGTISNLLAQGNEIS
jgi:Recombinase